MSKKAFQVIDPRATGLNIWTILNKKGVSIRTLQQYFGFESPQAIYKWCAGQSLPSLDNLYALSGFLQIPIDNILVPFNKDKGHDLEER